MRLCTVLSGARHTLAFCTPPHPLPLRRRSPAVSLPVLVQLRPPLRPSGSTTTPAAAVRLSTMATGAAAAAVRQILAEPNPVDGMKELDTVSAQPSTSVTIHSRLSRLQPRARPFCAATRSPVFSRSLATPPNACSLSLCGGSLSSPSPSSVAQTKFTKTVALRGLRINPKHCKTFMDHFKRQLLNIPRFRNIVPDPVIPASPSLSQPLRPRSWPTPATLGGLLPSACLTCCFVVCCLPSAWHSSSRAPPPFPQRLPIRVFC